MNYLRLVMTALLVSCGVVVALVVLAVWCWNLLLFIADALYGSDSGNERRAEIHS